MIRVRDRLNIYLMIVLNLALGAIIYYLLFKFQFRFNVENTTTIIILLIVLVFLFLIRTTIEINSNNIVLSFLILKSAIDFKDIIEIKVEKISTFRKFAGYGYRININGDLGYVLGSSTCLKIVTKERTYYASFKEEYLKIILDNKNITIIDSRASNGA